jgi:hypothetical protein
MSVHQGLPILFRAGLRGLGKTHLRVLAFDDAPFTFESSSTAVVGLSVSLPSYVEGVLRGVVTVDGDDATRVLISMIRGSEHAEAARAILLDGIALGGFNVVDLDALHAATGLPVITLTRRKPDFEAMETAIRRHLPDRPDILRLIHAHPLFPYPATPNPVWASAVGATEEEAAWLIKKSLVRGSVPEPLRLAHLVASAIPGGPASRA